VQTQRDANLARVIANVLGAHPFDLLANLPEVKAAVAAAASKISALLPAHPEWAPESDSTPADSAGTTSSSGSGGGSGGGTSSPGSESINPKIDLEGLS
jgi:hypothetical protein